MRKSPTSPEGHALGCDFGGCSCPLWSIEGKLWVESNRRWEKRVRKKEIVGLGVSYPVIICLGTENMTVRGNPPGSGGGGGSSLPGTLWCKWHQPGLERALKWCCFPLFFMSPAFSAQGLLQPPGTAAPQSNG